MRRMNAYLYNQGNRWRKFGNCHRCVALSAAAAAVVVVDDAEIVCDTMQRGHRYIHLHWLLAVTSSAARSAD
jgi:hypothetical protein